jgi:high-affinity iron transporter
MIWTNALPTFVVTLREGVEAALVVGIVLAYLNKANQTRLNGWVWAGIGAGLAASALVGAIFLGTLRSLSLSSQDYAPVIKQGLEAGFGIIAIGLLSWMLVWMTRQARSMKSEVEGSIQSALNDQRGAGWGVFGLITIAVLREGFETVVFLAAQFQQGWVPTLGAIAGLGGAVIIGFLLFQLGVKINLRLFFQGMGILLLLIVAGLVVSALRHADAALVLFSQINPDYADLCPATGACILGPQVWDTSGILPDRQFPGIVLKALFGYTQNLYLVQAIAYLVFLGTVGTLYLQSIAGVSSPSPSSSSPSSS